MQRIRALVVLLLSAAAVSACSPVDGSAASSSVAWESCGDGAVQCATVPVPVDRAEPASPTVGIAVAKLPARDPATRRGTVIVHAGGPAPSLPLLTDPRRRTGVEELATWFDLVTFDSRGFGGSAALCDSAQAPPLNLLETEADRAEHRAAQQRYADSCVADVPLLARNVDSADVADDIDAIRAALGEERIAFFGNSYGTVFGQAYAARHGDRLSALYLDSVVDHTHGGDVDRARASDALLARFGQRCGSDPRCAPAGEDPLALWDEAVAAAPVPVPGQEPLTAMEIRSGSATLAEITPARFAAALRAARDGDGGQLASMMRRPAPAGTDAGQLTTCADFPAPDAAARADTARAAPRTGPGMSPDTWRCGGWPLPVTHPPAPLDAPDAPPSLLLNSTLDPTTHLAGANRVAAQLPGSTVVGVEGFTHAIYLGQPDNRCVRDAVHTYLLDGELPAPGTTCPSRSVPGFGS